MTDTAAESREGQIRDLRSEVGHLRGQLAQREAALAALNRRLLDLERNQAGIDGTARDAHAQYEARLSELELRIQSISVENADLKSEIERVYATKLFRIARPARRLYGLIRGL